MADTKKFCIHSDGLGCCDILSDVKTRQYCVEGPCPHEKILEYEPVKHGRWEEQIIYICNSDDVPIAPIRMEYKCSECGRTEAEREPYCHCGAKMDGGADNG